MFPRVECPQQFLPGLAGFPQKWGFVQGAQVNVPRLGKVPRAGVRGELWCPGGGDQGVGTVRGHGQHREGPGQGQQSQSRGWAGARGDGELGMLCRHRDTIWEEDEEKIFGLCPAPKHFLHPGISDLGPSQGFAQTALRARAGLSHSSWCPR